MWTPKAWYETARAEAAARPEFYRKMGELLLTVNQAAFPDMPRPELLKRLAAWNRRRLDAVPDLGRYPELCGMRELVDAQWRGWRDGAGLSDEQWIGYCAEHSYHRHHAPLEVMPHGCSYAYFPDSDVGPILANNLDSGPDEPFTAPDWPLANEHLIIGSVSSGVFFDERSPEIFPAPVMALVGRYCRTTAEALGLLARYNHFWGPGNLLITDRHRDTALVEKSACRIGVRRSPDGFGFITAMTAAEPGMHAYLADRRAYSLTARGLPADCHDTAYWRCADQRHRLMAELLDEARPRPTLEGLRRLIQFRDPARGLVCYNGERLTPDGPPCEYTLRTVIWLLAKGQARWWAKEGHTPSYANRQPDVTYRDVLLWS